ncbi:MAG: esterase/lipase family protein, partial [Solirubrobacterales bacterium]
MFGGGPEIWREGRVGAEAAGLLASPTWRGRGVERGDGRPVMLVPGFLAGDESLWMMSRWLRRIGYRTHGSGIRSNIGCSEQAIVDLEQRVVELSDRYDHPVTIIGHSRG